MTMIGVVTHQKTCPNSSNAKCMARNSLANFVKVISLRYTDVTQKRLVRRLSMGTGFRLYSLHLTERRQQRVCWHRTMLRFVVWLLGAVTKVWLPGRDFRYFQKSCFGGVVLVRFSCRFVANVTRE